MCIVGAELAGVITGAILAKQGLCVVVVDTPPQVGGGGSTPHRGYWLDSGHRDGHDVTDLEVGWGYGQVAAGVEVEINALDVELRVHLLPQLPPGARVTCVMGGWGQKGFAKLASEVFGVSDAGMPDFWKTLAQLGGATPEQREAATEVKLCDWLESNAEREEIRRAVLIMAKTTFLRIPRARLGWTSDALFRTEERRPADAGGLFRRRRVRRHAGAFGSLRPGDPRAALYLLAGSGSSRIACPDRAPPEHTQRAGARKAGSAAAF